MPSAEILRLAYGDGYVTHTPFVDTPYVKPSNKTRLIESILASSYGYPIGASAGSILWQIIGKVAGLFGVMRAKAGIHVRFLKYCENGKVLDVGCGNGRFLKAAVRRGWDALGLEPDPVTAAMARSTGCAVIQGTIEDFDPNGCKYDAITMEHVLEHLANPRMVLSKLRTALAEDGVLVSITPNPESLISRLFGISWYGLDPPRHLHIPTASALATLCKDVGFSCAQFTIARNTRWYAMESLSIRRFARAYKSQARLIPVLLRVLVILSSEIFGFHLGEEIVCVARNAQPQSERK
jgi:SAM-dependent methyltransferase